MTVYFELDGHVSFPAETDPTFELPGQAESTRVPRAGEVVAGRYRIEALVGQGGMASVLRAERLEGDGSRTGERVAIKWVRPDRGDPARSRERLLREARLVGRVAHPNVVRIFEVGEDLGSVFLVFELLDGEALSEWVHRGAFPPSAAVGVLMPVLRAVAAAHQAGVVHRDLKPQNIMLCPGSGGLRPIVFDFGISRSAPGGAAREVDQNLTQTGIMVGTPVYMPPEQLAGAHDAEPSFDVYALGVILYELLSGALPFESDVIQVLLAEKLERDPIPLRDRMPGIDPRLAEVVMRALAREPSARWPSVEAFGKALAACVPAVPYDGGSEWYDGPTDPRATVAVPLPARRSGSSAPWLLLAVGAVLVALASVTGVAVVLLRPDDGPTMRAVEMDAPRSATSDPPATGAAESEAPQDDPLASAVEVVASGADPADDGAGEPPDDLPVDPLAGEAAAEEGPPVDESDAVDEPLAAPAAPSSITVRPSRPTSLRRGGTPRRVPSRGAGQTGRLRVDEF